MSIVTLFPNAHTPTDPVHLDHEDVVAAIADGRWRSQIDALNALPRDSDEQREAKRNLPGIVWQGRFSRRDAKHCEHHSGLVALDIDGVPPDELPSIRATLERSEYTHILFTSPRRDGLKLIVRIPPDADAHAEHLAALGADMTSHLPKYYDHYADLARLCFVSYDPSIYYNEDSKVWTSRLRSRRAASKVKVTAPDDVVAAFGRIRQWADRTSTYADGSKHVHLVKVFTACNRVGLPLNDAVTMAYDAYATTPGTSPVSLDDYHHRADHIYRLYSHEHATSALAAPPSPTAPPAPDTQVPDRPSPPSGTYHHTDPVSWYNHSRPQHALSLIDGLNRTDDGAWVDADGVVVATWDGSYLVTQQPHGPLQSPRRYTPFQLLTLLSFNGNYLSALGWIVAEYFPADIPYMRVGSAYFKRITKTDRYGIERIEFKPWLKEEIKQDHAHGKDGGRAYLAKIPLYDDFTIRPDNLNYRPVIGGCYNLYAPFAHTPEPGDITWSRRLMEHIFGEQLSLGWRYMQMLYLHPDHLMPILVLVSRERQTGKTTFIDWLNIIFGANVANVGPEDLQNGFNATYATSNIIAIEETFVDKQVTVEKLKALSTAKEIMVNRKFISQYSVPFFGKIILASNHEDRFARIDQEETRFFIRKVGAPVHTNHAILDDLRREVPALLHYLTTLPPVDLSVDRSGFTPEELHNESLQIVKEESRTGMHKELYEHIERFFLNEGEHLSEFEADASNIKDKFFAHDRRPDILLYIKRTIRVDMRLTATLKRYYPFGQPGRQEHGRPYLFLRSMFVTEELDTPADVIPF